MTELPQRRRRTGTVILIASLALNALLGGYIAVQAYRRYEFVTAAAMPPRLLQLVKSRLPVADQALFDQAYQSRERQILVAQADYEKALSAAAASLVRPDFDDAAFRAVVAEAREKRLRAADLALETFLDTVAHISPAGRRDLVHRFGR
jgi:uncharacterized membrane protein